MDIVIRGKRIESIFTWIDRQFWRFRIDTAYFWESKYGQWLCEWNYHEPGVWWFSNLLEPDMHCKRCNKDIG